tara:strand:+ start:699 stop:869 length:171 start_codon:yes stop_codon:yes gene_type:complete
MVIEDVAEWLKQNCWSDNEIIAEITEDWGLDHYLARELFNKGKKHYQKQLEIGDLV